MHPMPMRIPDPHPEPDRRPQLKPQPDRTARRQIRPNLLRDHVIRRHRRPPEHHLGVLRGLVERRRHPVEDRELVALVEGRSGHGVVVDADLPVGVADGDVEGGVAVEVEGEGGDVEAGAVGAEDEEEHEEEEGGGEEEGEEDGAEEFDEAAVEAVVDPVGDEAGTGVMRVVMGLGLEARLGGG